MGGRALGGELGVGESAGVGRRAGAGGVEGNGVERVVTGVVKMAERDEVNVGVERRAGAGYCGTGGC